MPTNITQGIPTSMNLRTAALCLCIGLLIGACASAPPPAEPVVDDGRIACRDPRPMVCTMEYMPVCAELGDGAEQEYASKCNACADIAVVAYRPERCSTP